MKKKVLITLTCIFLAATLFCGGVLVGIEVGTFGSSKIKQACAQILPTWLYVIQVDRGDIKALKTSLNLQLDVEILKLHYLLQDAKKGEDVEKAKKLLKIIAEHRSKYPPVYSAYSSEKRSETNKAVGEILAGYK